MNRSLVTAMGLAGALSCAREPPRDVVATVGVESLTEGDLRALQLRTRSGRGRSDMVNELARTEALAQAARKAGIADRPDVKSRLRAAEREVLAQAWLEDRSGGAVPEGAIRSRYELKKASLSHRIAHVKHILVTVRGQGERAEKDALVRAESVRARLTGGQPFEEVARKESEDPASASAGGALPGLIEGRVDSVVFAAIAELPVGAVSEPVRGPAGYHVFKAVAPVETFTPSFEEVRGRLEAELRASAESEARSAAETAAGLRVGPLRAGDDG